VVPPETQPEKKVIFVINKIDLEEDNLPELSEKYQHIPKVEISALLNNGIKELKQKIVNLSMAGLDMEKSSVIPNLRHKKALEQTVESLLAVKAGLASKQEEEILAIDIKNSIDSLGTITGETASLDILDSIFNNFCIGKTSGVAACLSNVACHVEHGSPKVLLHFSHTALRGITSLLGEVRGVYCSHDDCRHEHGYH